MAHPTNKARECTKEKLRADGRVLKERSPTHVVIKVRAAGQSEQSSLVVKVCSRAACSSLAPASCAAQNRGKQADLLSVPHPIAGPSLTRDSAVQGLCSK